MAVPPNAIKTPVMFTKKSDDLIVHNKFDKASIKLKRMQLKIDPNILQLFFADGSQSFPIPIQLQYYSIGIFYMKNRVFFSKE